MFRLAVKHPDDACLVMAGANLCEACQNLLSDRWCAAFTAAQPNADININGIGIGINWAGLTITIIIKP